MVNVKDLLFALPIYGAALAITYDVGYFYGLDMGYFTMFSLAEHLVFAMQAIPFSLAFSLVIPAGIVSFELGSQKAWRETPRIPPEGAAPEEVSRIRTAVQS